jgi:predicted ATP-dependent serine protease
MIERLSSGSDRLDSILGGGLPRNGIILIGGNPGSARQSLPSGMCSRTPPATGDVFDDGVRTA